MSEQDKFLLPSVTSCPHRILNEGTGMHCRILAETLAPCGVDADAASVSDDVCQACCQVDPPLPGKLNQVLASLAFAHSQKVLSQDGLDAASHSQWTSLRESMGSKLPICYDDQRRITPRSALRVEVSGGTHGFQHPKLRGSFPSRTLTQRIPLPQTRSGVVRQWAVGVTTSPRREPTLETCLRSIIDAGWSDPHVFVDGSIRFPRSMNHLSVTWRERPLGALPAWLAALRELVHQNPHADAYLLAQDDAYFYHQEPLREYLEQALWPGERPGVLSLFYAGFGTEGGWHHAGWEWWWGAQAHVFSPSVARALLTDMDVAKMALAAEPELHIPIPEVLQGWVMKREIDVWYPCPSLVQHFGNSSTVWNDAWMTPGRRAPWYLGDLDQSFANEHALDTFPEELFWAKDRIAFGERVERGRDVMRKSRVILCGVCQNARDVLPRAVARIRRLGSMFQDYRVVIMDQGSHDGTDAFLEWWQTSDARVTHVPVGEDPQKYWDASSLTAFEFVMQVDLGMPGGWSYDGLADTFAEEAWDVVGANRLVQVHHRSPHPFVSQIDEAFFPVDEVGTEPRWERGDPWVPVQSCDGGLTVYTREAFFALGDLGRQMSRMEFHRGLNAAGFTRQFMNPSQITLNTPQ